MARYAYIPVFLIFALTVAPISTAKSRSKPRPSGGTYTLTVAGYVAGQGSADVSPGSSVHLTLTVAPESGGRGGPVDVTMPMTTPNRFAGDSTVLGRPAHFEGRLDVPDDEKERLLRGVRLVCHFHTTDAQPVRYASVIGWIPALAEAKDRIDNGDDDGGKGNNGNGNGNGNG
jgi:hypothetical protein